MTKKSLKRPNLPDGDRTRFFDLMRKLVLENGDPSVVRLAQQVDGYSHQAVYKALTGPRMPSHQIMAALAETLAGPERTDLVLQAWVRGVEEERQTPPAPAEPGPSVVQTRAPDVPEAHLPRLSPRETEVLALYAAGMTAKDTAERLGLSVQTVNTHIKSIKNKYAMQGLGRPTKAELARMNRGFIGNRWSSRIRADSE